MDDSAVVAAIKTQILALNGVSMELNAEDLQKWTTTYKEDKGHVATYMKLRQGQKYEDFCQIQSGLIARMMGGC